MAPRARKPKSVKQEEQVSEETSVVEETSVPEPVQEVAPIVEAVPEVTTSSVPEPEKPNFSNHFDTLMNGVVALTKKCKELEIEVKSLKYLYIKEHKPVKPTVKRKRVVRKAPTPTSTEV